MRSEKNFEEKLPAGLCEPPPEGQRRADGERERAGREEIQQEYSQVGSHWPHSEANYTGYLTRVGRSTTVDHRYTYSVPLRGSILLNSRTNFTRCACALCVYTGFQNGQDVELL